MDIGGVVGLVIGFLSLVFAIWESKERVKSEKMLQQVSFHLFHSVDLVLGDAQHTVRDILDNHVSNALKSAGNVEGGTQMLLKQTAKIVCYYNRPTDADVDDWISRGKIREENKSTFLSYSERPRRRGWLRSPYHAVSERIL